ncbi:Fur family transcriptional regulator [Allonocardiopsis opalescens]|nr:Fur family transcriptional regulator [Allonocardiopsis opalescens]
MSATWHQELRSRGYRVTPQRQMVLEAIEHLVHATPEEICAKVQETARGVNISTVYRTLELLEELGLVTHTHLSHGAPTYHLAEHADHIHLVCRDCGEVIEISPSVADGFVNRLRGELGFETDIHHLTVFGRCGGCPGDHAPAGRASQGQHHGR